MDCERKCVVCSTTCGMLDLLVTQFKIAFSCFSHRIRLICVHCHCCFQERAHEYYNGMTKEQFKNMQEFIAGRSSKKPSSKM